MSQPPPVSRQKRSAERVELIVAVECSSGGDVYLLRARNASVNGLFLEGSPSDYPSLQVGLQVELAVFEGSDLEGEPIQLKARIVRLERRAEPFRPGFGLQVTVLEGDHRARFQALLDRQRALR
jgi:hypothetical protein